MSTVKKVTKVSKRSVIEVWDQKFNIPLLTRSGQEELEAIIDAQEHELEKLAIEQGHVERDSDGEPKLDDTGKQIPLLGMVELTAGRQVARAAEQWSLFLQPYEDGPDGGTFLTEQWENDDCTIADISAAEEAIQEALAGRPTRRR